MTSLAIVIPTYNRGEMLVQTIEQLLAQSEVANEIIIVDQTQYQAGDRTAKQLTQFAEQGKIRWLQREEPSIPKAMNHGLLKAMSQYVLFLDDDIEIGHDFIHHHKESLTHSPHHIHVGQVVQPWQRPNQQVTAYEPQSGLYQDLAFPFNSDRPAKLKNCMAGNLCVDRQAAIDAGGFDENFIGVAYRFETEFAKRFCQYHETDVLYFPAPVLNHLHIQSGGTRSHADVLRSISPLHSVGDYYFALLRGKSKDRLLYIARRFIGSIKAKFYLRRPWFLPVRLIAEVRGLMAAVRSIKSGQALVSKLPADNIKTINH